MPYESVVQSSWDALVQSGGTGELRLRFLAGEYLLDTENRRIRALPSGSAVKDFLSILLLHYASRKIQGLPAVLGEWISFEQLPGGMGYYPAFKKRVLSRLRRRYADNPGAWPSLPQRFRARPAPLSDAGMVLDVFENVPVLLTVWEQDEEFGAEANIHFDRSITDIFCTEDIVVMSELICVRL